MDIQNQMIGELQGFSPIIGLAMLREQYLQTKRIDISVFQVNKYAGKFGKGFDWDETNADSDFWNIVIDMGDQKYFFNHIDEL